MNYEKITINNGEQYICAVCRKIMTFDPKTTFIRKNGKMVEVTLNRKNDDDKQDYAFKCKDREDYYLCPHCYASQLAIEEEKRR